MCFLLSQVKDGVLAWLNVAQGHPDSEGQRVTDSLSVLSVLHTIGLPCRRHPCLIVTALAEDLPLDPVLSLFCVRQLFFTIAGT